MVDFNEPKPIDAYADKIARLAEIAAKNDHIDPALYALHDVKRGLREANGKGVLCGLTEVSEVNAWKTVDGVKVPIDGELRFHGVDVKDIVKNCVSERRFGFEETVYLLLFGELPSRAELDDFIPFLKELCVLPKNFLRDVILKKPNKDIMNMMSKCVLNLYSYDPDPDNISRENVLRQSLSLIAQLPRIAVYSYRAYQYYFTEGSLVIHKPQERYSFAENILHMLRKNSQFTDLEASVLDICLILHAEHGGGNNSTFTNHVVTSSGTDTYSAVAASLGSLKGPKHGGANLKVVEMFDNIKENLPDWSESSVRDYIKKIVDKEAFDRTGLVYGMGHAVYTLSDPRAEILKSFAGRLAVEKGREEEFELYNTVAKVSKELIMESRNVLKAVCPNVDFYSGFVYQMLSLPKALYTPLFAVSRIAGWSAHRMEEIVNGNRIIRPAYECVQERKAYVPIDQR
ncbi:MAG: citrate/2-methylcitrate synthase [Clostridia bacterium]|nr:citrate/2-methylcitrate synthase [Clostridia bacterium]